MDRPILDTLPTEILLAVISNIPYDHHLPRNICLVCQRFHALIHDYEHSLVNGFLSRQSPWAIRQFPGLFKSPSSSMLAQARFKDLMIIEHRLSALAVIDSRCNAVRGLHAEQTACSTDRALRMNHAGLLILYRLSDCTSMQEARDLVKSLPKSSLAVLQFALIMAISTIWTSGWGMIINYIAVNTAASKNEIELVCEEVILQHGPEILRGLLCNDIAAIKVLKEEYASMEERQAPMPEGTSRPPTLIATLKQASAATLGCEMQYNKVLMWDVLDGECAAIVNDDKVQDVTERLVNGEALLGEERDLWCLRNSTY